MMNTLTTILEKDNPNRGVSPRTSSFDEMRGLTPLANLVTSALTNQYSYDGLGNRTLRTVNGIQHRDVLDRSAALHNVLMTTDAAGNPLRYYIWGRGLVAQIETNGTVYYYHPDTRGSTLAMTDASGSTVAEYAYSPYGQIMNHT
ncbi:MAG: hypothetical protein EOM12_12085, partial [Verrucomicrobiae bacterium]|nr:hypothetical protein [Verrucomicrobiae bacterium]